MWKLVITAILTFTLAGIANAVVIGNGPPNQSGGSDMTEFLEADNFSLGAAFNSVNLIRFWSLQGSAADYAGSIDWSIRKDAAGSPGAVSASGLATPVGVATGVPNGFGLNEFLYQFSVNAILTAGNYWLVLHDGPNGSQPATTFFWEWSKDTGDSQNFDQLIPGQGWTGNFVELAFQLETVPEPAPIALIGVGLLAAFFARRRGHGKFQAPVSA